MSESPTMMESEDMTMRFNIADKPWLPVSFLGKPGVKTLSLRETFHQSAEIEDIQIDPHAERQAVIELLGAFFYRSVTTFDPDLTYKQTVHAVLSGDISIGEVIDRYLDDYVLSDGSRVIERLDILDEERPFLQIPGWESKTPDDIPSLFSEVTAPIKRKPVESSYASRAASQVSLSSIESLSLSESVIPLIWASQGWCPKGGSATLLDGSPVHPHKPGAGGRFFVSGGTDGVFLLVPHLSVVGENLLGTLALSSPDIEGEDDWSMDDDTAVWELPDEKRGFYGRLTDAVRGPADLITFSRAGVLLVLDGDRVVGAHYSPNNTMLMQQTGSPGGRRIWMPEPVRKAAEEYPLTDGKEKFLKDRIPASSMAAQTPVGTRAPESPISRFHPTAFIMRKVETKKGKESVSFVTRFIRSGGFWEGIGALTALGDRSPRIIQWMRELVEHYEIVPEEGVVEVRYTYVLSGQNKIAEIVSDVLYLGSPVARGKLSSDEVLNEISDGVNMVLGARDELCLLERRSAIASGVRPNQGAQPFKASGPFMEYVRPDLERYIAAVTEETEPEEVGKFFRGLVRLHATKAIEQASSQVPPSYLGTTREDDRGNLNNISHAISDAKFKIKKMTEVTQ